MIAFEKQVLRLDDPARIVALNDPLVEASRRMLGSHFAEILRLSGQIAHDEALVGPMLLLVERMQQVFAVLGEHYKAKILTPYLDDLQKLARRLRRVADGQHLLADLETADALSAGIKEHVQQRHEAASQKLNKYVHSKSFGKFAKSFAKFLTKDGQGAIKPSSATSPSEVRHLAPVLLHDALARLRACETLLSDDPEAALLDFIEQVRVMRALVAFFEPVLGASIREFDAQLARMAEPLQVVDQLAAAQRLLDDNEPLAAAYIENLQSQVTVVIADLPTLWERFNTRTTLRKFSDALLVLR